MKASEKLMPIWVAGMIVTAPTVPGWALAVVALLLEGLSAFLFWSDRKIDSKTQEDGNV